jgi:peptidoglycan/LPS O-acetylase OafA/YrhL
LIVSNTLLTRSGFYGITLRRSFDALCFAGLIWSSALHTGSLLGRILNATPLVWVGRMSYGLYLWQQPFLNPRGDSWACQWPINVVLALLIAVVSFVLIERPALWLRQNRGWGCA